MMTDKDKIALKQRKALEYIEKTFPFDGPDDHRVYLVDDLVLATAKEGIAGPLVIEPLRKEFPKLVELLLYVNEHRETRFKGLNKFHVSVAPTATVETLSAELLRQFKEDGYGEPLDLGDLSWRDKPRSSLDGHLITHKIEI